MTGYLVWLGSVKELSCAESLGRRYYKLCRRLTSAPAIGMLPGLFAGVQTLTKTRPWAREAAPPLCACSLSRTSGVTPETSLHLHSRCSESRGKRLIGTFS